MTTTKLTDTEARIASITTENGTTTVNLEWGGPSDREVYDFDLARLGKIMSHGGTLRSGWVILDGPCLLRVGEAIPYLDHVIIAIKRQGCATSAGKVLVVDEEFDDPDYDRHFGPRAYLLKLAREIEAMPVADANDAFRRKVARNTIEALS